MPISGAQPFPESYAQFAPILGAHFHRFFHYNDMQLNCQKYGTLYIWDIAKDICPEGWHLPSRDEWEILRKYLSREKEEFLICYYQRGIQVLTHLSYRVIEGRMGFMLIMGDMPN